MRHHRHYHRQAGVKPTTETNPYNTPTPLERRAIQVQTGYTGRRVTNSPFQFLGTQGDYFSASAWGTSTFLKKYRVLMVEGGEIRTRGPKPMPSTPDVRVLVRRAVWV